MQILERIDSPVVGPTLLEGLQVAFIAVNIKQMKDEMGFRLYPLQVGKALGVRDRPLLGRVGVQQR
jgi:hypothetical protein